jgi:hypothetical protein
MSKEPKAGSRMSQARVDAATRGRDAKAKALKRTVTDKATGAKVFPSKDYQAYQKADRAVSTARIKNMTPAQKAKIKAKTKK